MTYSADILPLFDDFDDEFSEEEVLSREVASARLAEPLRPVHESLPAAQQGDEQAFGDLWRRYHPYVFAISARIAGHYRAEDLSQETAIKIFRFLPGFKPPVDAQAVEYSATAWIKRITISNAIDALRKDWSRLQPESLDKWYHEFGNGLHDTLEDPGAEMPGDALASREAVARALAKVPEIFRNTVLAVDVNGDHYEEYAADAGVKLGTVRSQLHRGRAALKQNISDEEIDGLMAS